LKGDCCKDRVSSQPSFEEISFGSLVYLYKTYYSKSLLRKNCKEGGYLLLPIFGSPHKKEENKKKVKKIQKKKIKNIYIAVRKDAEAQKKAKNWLRRFKNAKIEI
jgi:hypothetical protein